MYEYTPHGLITYIDTKWDFAAGVYQSLETGETVSHDWYFRPSFVNCCPSPLLYGSTLPPPPFHV